MRYKIMAMNMTREEIQNPMDTYSLIMSGVALIKVSLYDLGKALYASLSLALERDKCTSPFSQSKLLSVFK